MIYVDPTLLAIDQELEKGAALEPPRSYLGMSGIGHPCDRKLWFDFHWAQPSTFPAATLKKFACGHHGEDLQAERLRMVPGVVLETHHPDGKQIGFSDIAGHFRGHMDGVIKGLLHDPENKYVWEHKQVAQSNQNKLQKLIDTHGQDKALKEWNYTYYAQAVLYMSYSKIPRHYMTVSTAGGRETISLITYENEELASQLIRKAEGIVNATEVPNMMAQASKTWFECKWCPYYDTCFNAKAPIKTCRSCSYARPSERGEWTCNLHQKFLALSDQDLGCNHYKVCL